MERLTCLVAIFACACAMPASYTSTPLSAAARAPRAHTPISEAVERQRVAFDGRARLIDLGGDEHSGTTLTIHGINAAPDDVATLSNAALARGEHVVTIAYDDNYRRLQATADDFGRQVEALQSMLAPHTRLRIDAHSMGARVIVVALDRLQRAGRLTHSAVELHLIAPLLSGLRVANFSGLTPLLLPFGLSKLVKNAEPARDLARNGAFQRELEAARFPAQVQVSITLAQHDKFAKKDATCLKLAQRWRASIVTLPNTTHMSVINAAAADTRPNQRAFGAPEHWEPTARHAARHDAAGSTVGGG